MPANNQHSVVMTSVWSIHLHLHTVASPPIQHLSHICICIYAFLVGGGAWPSRLAWPIHNNCVSCAGNLTLKCGMPTYLHLNCRRASCSLYGNFYVHVYLHALEMLPKNKKKKRTKNEGGIQRSVEMEAFSGQRLHCMKMAMEWGKSWGKAGELRPTDGNQFAGCRK